MKRWHVYSYLKQTNGSATMDDLLHQFYEHDSESIIEIMEGIAEYNIMSSFSHYNKSHLTGLENYEFKEPAQ